MTDCRRRLLCVCYEFPPQTTPTAIRAGKLLERLVRDWDLEVLTAAADAELPIDADMHIRYVAQPRTSRLRKFLQRARLSKITELRDWPDDKRAWIAPAINAALAAVAENPPAAIVVFMMPYSAGLVGLELKRRTGLPVLMNLDDSPTCGDMNATFPTAWHYRRTVAFEDHMVAKADAIVYVSQRNLDRVRDRQPLDQRGKLHLVRYGADSAQFAAPLPAREDDEFQILYIGGMTGWYSFYNRPSESLVRKMSRRILRAWDNAGRYQLASLDQRPSSPVFVAKAVQQVIRDVPALRSRIWVDVYGNRYPREVVDQVLANEGVSDVVRVHGPVSNDRAIELARRADILFLALPDRPDGSAGGRISAKTYEYLMTDRPILAAVPQGENADYLAGEPGLAVVHPTDVSAMAAAIRNFADVGRSRFPRCTTKFDYDERAEAFAAILEQIASKAPSRFDPVRVC